MLTVFNQSLWGDEAFSAILSTNSLPEIVRIIIKDTSPPLWNIFEWAIFNTLGTDEIYIRLLSFIFFAGAVFFTYKIGELLFEKKTGLIAAVLTFLNPFFFTYAFEGRMYSILALGVTASMYYFLKKNWALFVFWTLWALYSHHFAIFAVFVTFFWFVAEFIWGNKKNALLMLKSFFVIGIGYLPWVYPLYLQATRVGGGFWLGTPTLMDLRNLIYEYLAEGIKSHPFKLLGKGLGQFALWSTFATLLLRRWDKSFKKSAFLLTWFLIPILATWVISQKFTSIFFNRYLLYTIPASMLILASLRRKASVALIAVVLVLFALIDWHYFFHPAKIPFRDLATYVAQTKDGEDFLINEDAGNHKLWESKYYGIPAPIYNPEEGALPFFVGTALMQERDVITEIPKGINRLGVITYKSGSELEIAGFEFSQEKRFGALNFVWMDKSSR
ncbi:MAG TPA: glycosyltransferase family 39 protein [Patescibacteria group bacterium]|nr:glycosyltransferase family 39 protein [Patescibacteria group bacterium]